MDCRTERDYWLEQAMAQWEVLCVYGTISGWNWKESFHAAAFAIYTAECA